MPNERAGMPAPPNHSPVYRAHDMLRRVFQRTRGRVPAGAKKIALFGGNQDAAHTELALDAFATHAPESSLELVADSRLDDWDCVVLLHPRPWLTDEKKEELHHARKAFHRAMMLRPRAHPLIFYRNLELWNGRPIASALRKLLTGAIGALERRIETFEDQLLDSKVFPFLHDASNWNREAPCSHENRERLLVFPRPLDFCPACGMGLTPPDRISRLDDSATCYGPDYARYDRFVGDREFLRFVGQNAARVEGYLRDLEFPAEFDASPPRVLDFGCGNGRLLPLWNSRGFDYLGIDYSADNIESARQMASKLALNRELKVEFMGGDLEALLCRCAAPFDVVFLSHVLEHVRDPVDLLSRLLPLSKPCGRLYIEVPNAFAYTWSRHHRGYRNLEHLWDFTPAMLARISEAAGWTIEKRLMPADEAAYPYIALHGVNLQSAPHRR